MIPLSILWPRTEGREQTLGIQAGWSIPLSQVVGPEEMARLDRLLHDTVSQATTSATEHVLGEADAMTWRVTIEQIGSEAEPVHHAIAIFESVPREVLASLVALGTERVVSGIVSLVRQALGKVRETAGSDEAHLELRYHPDLLMQMCREEAIQRYGLRSIERCEWQQAGELERSPDEHGPMRPLFLITVQGDGKHVEYLVDDGGDRPGASGSGIRRRFTRSFS